MRYDDRVALYSREDAQDLELAYAATVHKSQGSEFDAVILPLYHNQKLLCYRNLLYTAVTRAVPSSSWWEAGRRCARWWTTTGKPCGTAGWVRSCSRRRHWNSESRSGIEMGCGDAKGDLWRLAGRRVFPGTVRLLRRGGSVQARVLWAEAGRACRGSFRRSARSAAGKRRPAIAAGAGGITNVASCPFGMRVR